MGDFKHTPVLLDEVVYYLNVLKGKKYIDATFGTGGHSKEILKREGIVLGIEADNQSLKLAEENFKRESQEKRIIIANGNFGDLEKIAKQWKFESVYGILFDLGVSSWQIDESKRGFSYLKDEYLDMRYNQKQKGETASQILNTASFEEIVQIIEKYGEEEKAAEAAKAIVDFRRRTPLATSGQLTEILTEKFDYLPEKRRVKLLSRVYQALRIAVNPETENLKKGLDSGVRLLHKNGRLVVISFHSLEDRIVKFALKNEHLKILTKKPLLPTVYEIRRNIRARSAKLRAGEKI